MGNDRYGRAYTCAETVANLRGKTGCGAAEAEQELEIARHKAREAGLDGPAADAFAYTAARNALTDIARKRARRQAREVSIFNEVLDGVTFADIIEDTSAALREEREERRDRLDGLLRESGRRAAELADLCVAVADELGPGAQVCDIQRGLYGAWRVRYPYANDRDYYWLCERVRRVLRML